MRSLSIGFVLSLFIAYVAFKKESLNFSGFIAAVLLGTFIYLFGGVYFCALMVGFFVSSSILTKFKVTKKEELNDINEKGGKRDYAQVVANGLLGFIFALLYYIYKSPLCILAYSIAFASSNADTWASEIGVLSKRKPISIINFKSVEKGMSGGISVLGTAAAFLGSIFIAAIFLIGFILKFGYNDKLSLYFLLVAIGGFIGSIIDSYIGATLQGKYRCKVCNKIVEKKIHHKQQTLHIKGLKYINNDVVNFLSGFLATIITLFLLLRIP